MSGTAGDRCGPHVRCSDLSVQAGGVRILDNVTFEALPGTIHCLIGPNGGGKSTLLKTLLGQHAHQGEVTLQWPEAGGHIGYVPQYITIDPTLPLTVVDFMALCVQRRPAFLGRGKDPDRQIREVLAMLDLQDRARSPFAKLSGGERQRALFAQALIPRPGLLLLDEPMNSIDRSGANIFSRQIKMLAAQGVTVIWVHHDLVQVRTIADYVTCLNRSVLFSGPPAEVMQPERMLEVFSAGAAAPLAS